MHEPANSADVAHSQSFDKQTVFSCMSVKNWRNFFSQIRIRHICADVQNQRVPAHAGADLLMYYLLEPNQQTRPSSIAVDTYSPCRILSILLCIIKNQNNEACICAQKLRQYNSAKFTAPGRPCLTVIQVVSCCVGDERYCQHDE